MATTTTTLSARMAGSSCTFGIQPNHWRSQPPSMALPPSSSAVMPSSMTAPRIMRMTFNDFCILYRFFLLSYFFSMAYTAKPATLLMPVLRVMLLRWVFTVFTAMLSLEAISLLLRPCATNSSTSCSRSLSW